MRAMELLMYYIVYIFELSVLVLLLIGIYGYFAKDTDNEILKAIYDVFFKIDDEDKDYYIL